MRFYQALEGLAHGRLGSPHGRPVSNRLTLRPLPPGAAIGRGRVATRTFGAVEVSVEVWLLRP